MFRGHGRSQQSLQCRVLHLSVMLHTLFTTAALLLKLLPLGALDSDSECTAGGHYKRWLLYNQSTKQSTLPVTAVAVLVQLLQLYPKQQLPVCGYDFFLVAAVKMYAPMPSRMHTSTMSMQKFRRDRICTAAQHIGKPQHTHGTMS